MARLLSFLLAAAVGQALVVGSAWSEEAAPEVQRDRFLLASGQWMLAGFESLEDQALEVQGAEIDQVDFGDLTLGFEDVVEAIFQGENTFVFPNRKTVVGRARVAGTEISIQTEEGTERFPRSDLVSVAKGRPSERSLWSGGASLGVTSNSGNSNELQLLVLAHAVRQGEKVRFSADYRNNLSKTDGVDTVKNQKTDARVDLFVGDRIYLTPAMIEHYSDAFQNIDWRVSPGAGAGYQILEGPRSDWSVDSALIYQKTQYVSTLASQSASEDAAAIRLHTRFNFKLSSHVELGGDYSVTVNLENSEDVTQHSLLKLDIAATRHLELNLAFIWDRVGDPQANALGVLPEKDDYKVSFGVGFHF